MKPCRSKEDRIDLWIRDALGATERREIEEHLDCCAACRQWSADLKEIHQMVRQMPKTTAPEGFEDRVRQRLSAADAAIQSTRPAWRYAAVAAALLVLLLGTVVTTVFVRTRNQSDKLAGDQRPAVEEVQSGSQIVVKTGEGAREVIQLPSRIDLQKATSQNSYAYLMNTSH
ncbi:MAG: anti-sigma factor family protein [Acidobacteriota bacterium]